MSEMLGPVHYMMYEKIKFQDVITSYLMDNNTSKIDEKIAPVSTDSLENLIDQENIHGWLSSRIDIVENRLNMAFNLSENTDKKLFELGKKVSQGKNFQSIDGIFNDLNMFLLDGMPCDNGISAMLDQDGNLLLVTNENLHDKYDFFVNPESSLDDTCEGGHGHDHHDSFDISENLNIELKEGDSNYHNHRYHFLKGYFDDSAYDVELVNGINYKIFK